VVNPIVNTLEFGRQKATILYVSPSVQYAFTPITFGTAAYSYTRATLEAGATNTDHNVLLSLSHQFTPVDTGQARYSLDVFESSVSGTQGLDVFGSSASGTQVSHAFTLGWSRQLTPATSATLNVGPRFTQGTVSPEVEARLDHQFRVSETPVRGYLSYSRSESLVLGQNGPSKTQIFSGGIGFEPLRSLEISVGAAITKLSGSPGSSGSSGSTNSDTTVYAFSAGASYQIFRWLVARASYGFAFQDQSGGDIRRNVLSVSLEALYPYRVDQ